MEKLQMCRLCLAEGIRMQPVVDKNLHDIYEKLTNIPFVTEDRRPMLSCFICFTKLKDCHRFVMKCLEAEGLFTRMMNEDYKPNPSSFYNGFIQRPIDNINTVDVGQTESITIKEELPVIFERPGDVIEPKKEHQIVEIKLENVDNSYPDTEAEVVPAHLAESRKEYEVPLMEITIKVEKEQELIGVPIANTPELDTRRTNPEDTTIAGQKKNENPQNLSTVPIIQKTRNQSAKPVTEFKESLASSINNSAVDSINNKIKCKISNKSRDSDDKNRHRRLKEKCFVCDICQRSFTERYYLKRHSRTHAGEKPYKCDICQRNFSDKRHLTNHTRTHTGEKPFQCDICERSFINKRNLKEHIRMHTGEKPYKCQICQRSFSHQTNLATHGRVHTGERPFKCDVCQRSFCIKTNLTRHILTHTGERPFKCNICQSSFNQKRYLTRHTTHAHSIDTVEKLQKNVAS